MVYPLYIPLYVPTMVFSCIIRFTITCLQHRLGISNRCKSHIVTRNGCQNNKEDISETMRRGGIRNNGSPLEQSEMGQKCIYISYKDCDVAAFSSFPSKSGVFCSIMPNGCTMSVTCVGVN